MTGSYSKIKRRNKHLFLKLMGYTATMGQNMYKIFYTTFSIETMLMTWLFTMGECDLQHLRSSIVSNG